MAETAILQPSNPNLAARHFAWRLRFETDPYDVKARIEAGDTELTLIDTRSPADYYARHLPGAISIPLADMTQTRLAELDSSKQYVTYGADPACNGATKGAMELAAAGLEVQEMLGGIEYWIRAGFATAESDQTDGPADLRGDSTLSAIA